jgi:general secretion pathway protein G
MMRHNRSAGFTLIEILVVLVILGMLAGLVGPRLFTKVDSSKVKTAETQVKMLKAALQTFRLDLGRYPHTDEGLGSLMKRTSGPDAQLWAGPYLEEEVPLDPWGAPYQYSEEPSGTQEFTLYSFGADGAAGGEGLDADIGYLP